MWLVMALTSLMKGLLGFVLPIMVIGVYSVFADGWLELERRLLHGALASRINWLVGRNRWFFNWHTIVAVASAAVVYGAPFIISHASSGSARGIHMVYRENVERYFAPFDHRGPIYLYVYVIFGLMAPWSVFLPAALVQAHQRDARTSTPGLSPGQREGNVDCFVLVFFWTTFIFFTLSGSRRSYYILPILPAAAILVARAFTDAEADLSESVQRLLKIGYGLVIAVVAFSIVVLLPPRWFLPKPYAFLPMAPYPGVFAAYWVGAVVVAGYPLIRYRRERKLLAVSAISYLLMFYLFVFAMPAGDQWRPEKPFAEQIRRIIGGHPSELASFKIQPPVFYLGLARPVPEYDNLSQLESAIRNGQVKWIVSRRRDVKSLDFPGHITAVETTYPWDSSEHRLNALVLMETGG
jgi:4-amino-4-deoxy-L-arabinose transferase-like glycosyltransferase